MVFIDAVTLNYNNFEPKPNCYFQVFSTIVSYHFTCVPE